MPKYNVGVGDAFPADVTDSRADRDGWTSCRPDEAAEPGEAELARRYRKRRRTSENLLRAVVILLGIWAALHFFAHGGPSGLLLAAAIVLSVWVAHTVFGGSERRAERRAWRAECRRRRSEG